MRSVRRRFLLSFTVYVSTREHGFQPPFPVSQPDLGLVTIGFVLFDVLVLLGSTSRYQVHSFLSSLVYILSWPEKAFIVHIAF